MRQLFRSKFKITQEFGVNAEYYKQFGLKAHEGLDIIPTGLVWDVMTVEDGVVVKDEDNSLSGIYGVFCTLWHSRINKATQYCHLKENYVENGQIVKRGDKIGLMGKTGNTSGVHLHLNLFETDTNGIRLNKNNGYLGGIDPLPFLNEDVEPIDTSALDECKKQVEKEIKAKNETYQELVEVKNDLEATNSEVITHQNYIKQLAITLNVETDTAKILGQITKLISEEDQLRQTLQKLQDSEKEVKNTEEHLDACQKMAQTTAKEKQTLSEALQELTLKNNDLQNRFDQISSLKKLTFKRLFWRIYIGGEKKDGKTN